MQNQESENLEAAAILLAMGRPIGGEGEEETARQKPFGKDGISFPTWWAALKMKARMEGKDLIENYYAQYGCERTE